MRALSILAALVGLTVAGAVKAGSLPLPPEQLAIAVQVAGAGLPQCRSYHPDGSEQPCLPSFAVKRSSLIAGWSRAGRITFSQAATDRLTRDEFALLAGHEIAHWYLGHHGSNRAAEQAADLLGAELACRAGFDLVAGAALFRHLRPSKAHPPGAMRRALVLQAGCANGPASRRLPG